MLPHRRKSDGPGDALTLPRTDVGSDEACGLLLPRADVGSIEAGTPPSLPRTPPIGSDEACGPPALRADVGSDGAESISSFGASGTPLAG